jgi:hypothetical protein
MTRSAARFLIVAAVVLAIVAALGGQWLVVVAMALVLVGQLAVLRGRR